jgi:hypothetical protein
MTIFQYKGHYILALLEHDGHLRIYAQVAMQNKVIQNKHNRF